METNEVEDFGKIIHEINKKSIIDKYAGFVNKLNEINAKKLAVVGSRDFPLIDRAQLELNHVIENTGIDTIVSGGAIGIDTLAEQYAIKNGLKTIIHPAEWDKYGRSAGYIRNKNIVDDADAILIFWYKDSKGTKYTLDLSKKSNKPLYLLQVVE